jgi:hypothetical protein
MRSTGRPTLVLIPRHGHSGGSSWPAFYAAWQPPLRTLLGCKSLLASLTRLSLFTTLFSASRLFPGHTGKLPLFAVTLSNRRGRSQRRTFYSLLRALTSHTIVYCLPILLPPGWPARCDPFRSIPRNLRWNHPFLRLHSPQGVPTFRHRNDRAPRRRIHR